jgi:TetR/AcrR family transcriptional regulator, transcriptional repressor of aconitase
MPRISPERAAAVRRQILDGARRAFAQHGYEGATVRILEQEIGLTRGAIFHHFPDKDALFLTLAEEDAAAVADIVEREGLIAVMRQMVDRDPGWLGVSLEVSRRLRTDPEFRAAWRSRIEATDSSTHARLERGRAAGTVRTDVPVEVLVLFLQLLHDGLIVHLSTGDNVDVTAVLDLAEAAVRTTNKGTR